MSCDIVSYIVYMFYILCELIVTIETIKLICISYIVSIIRVNGIMLTNSNIVDNIIISLLYITRFMYFTVIENIS